MEDKISCMTVPESAKILRISKSAAYNLANDPNFYPAFRIGKRILINCAKLEEWVQAEASAKGGK